MSSSSSLTTVVASPTLSTASWSQLDNVYQLNVTAANQVIQDFLNSPHNTWNYPSPLDSPRPARERYSVPPVSPIVAVDRINTLPNFLHVLADVAAQQAYILSPQLQYPPPTKPRTPMSTFNLRKSSTVSHSQISQLRTSCLPSLKPPLPSSPRLPRPLLSSKSSPSLLFLSMPSTNSSLISGLPLPVPLPTMFTPTSTPSVETHYFMTSSRQRRGL